MTEQDSALKSRTSGNTSPYVEKSSDSRPQVPCKFQSRSGGCHRPDCSFSHDLKPAEVDSDDSQKWKQEEDEHQDFRDDFVRELAGAYVQFEENGDIGKVSLSSDFSSTCITGLQPDATSSTVVEDLRSFGFSIATNCVRITGLVPELKAIVKVEDPLFAKDLSNVMQRQQTTLLATPIHDGAKHASYRKVYVSWHKATRSVWLNFGNGPIANRVAQNFNDGKYRIRGQQIKSTAGKESTGRARLPSHPRIWTIILGNVPANAGKQDIEAAIKASYDKPRHIELGKVSHGAAEVEVSVEVRKHLEKCGQLESFHFTDSSTGKRARATAWFLSDADARSACALNDKSLKVLGNGKLTVSLVQSVTIKIPVAILSVSTSKIKRLEETWRQQNLRFRQFKSPFRRYATIKIESEDPKSVARAHKALDGILAGQSIANGEEVLWDPALERNGRAYQRTKMLEAELGVLITRDKLKRQLRFYGSEDKLEQTTRSLVAILTEENYETFKIELTPDQFSWAVRGGFRRVEHALGENIAVLDVRLKTITIDGTQAQYQTAIAIMEGEEASSAAIDMADREGDCPICFCEADNGIATSCGHIYCLDCFENSCRSVAQSSGVRLEVKCQGDAGTCSKLFNLRELDDYLSTSIFESMLGTFFGQYVQRHATAFRYCPTPDCGFIYRCAEENTPEALLGHICPNCLESVCRSCHARHGHYTCAEYEDIASGGYAALAKLKAELNIKDCPECTTPMEKTEGCNHMTCPGCKKHICWVCLEVFDSSGPCYAHMTRAHGGIGLDHLVEI